MVERRRGAESQVSDDSTRFQGGAADPVPSRERLDRSSAPLTFAELARVNTSRCVRWHDPATDAWTGADWSNAMCGEAGEAANVVKKLRRHETRTNPPGDPDETTLRRKLGHEIADTILYAFLLAEHYGIDVAANVIEKFNLVSERNGYPERL